MEKPEKLWKNRKMGGKTGKGLSAQWVIEVKWSPLFLREALSGEHQVKVDPTPWQVVAQRRCQNPGHQVLRGPNMNQLQAFINSCFWAWSLYQGFSQSS